MANFPRRDNIYNIYQLDQRCNKTYEKIRGKVRSEIKLELEYLTITD